MQRRFVFQEDRDNKDVSPAIFSLQRLLESLLASRLLKNNAALFSHLVLVQCSAVTSIIGFWLWVGRSGSRTQYK